MREKIAPFHILTHSIFFYNCREHSVLQKLRLIPAYLSEALSLTTAGATCLANGAAALVGIKEIYFTISVVGSSMMCMSLEPCNVALLSPRYSQARSMRMLLKVLYFHELEWTLGVAGSSVM